MKGDVIVEIKTRITEMLGIKFPIVLGGMKGLGNHRLAAAVSNAGGLGMITSGNFKNIEDLKREIQITRNLTDKPFGVNISLNPGAGSNYGAMTKAYVDLVCEEGITTVETSGYSPEGIVKQLHKNGIKVIHKVPSARFALKAAKTGVDAVAVVGYESGGHPGLDYVAGQIVLQKVCQQLDIPILLGAGVIDGKGLVSALALGADGVLLGTRFAISQESPAHQNMKQWLLNAHETDTCIAQESIRNPIRVIKNGQSLKVIDFETSNPSIDQLMPLINGAHADEAMAIGDVQNCLFSIGQAVGLINDIPTVQEIVDMVITTAEDAVKRINNMLRL